MSDYQSVFVGSTSYDLGPHRSVLRDLLLSLDKHPVMMEHWTAVDASAVEESLRRVDDAEVYVGVFGYRYGFIPPGHDVSITELEYERAVAQGKPRLVFLIADDHPVSIKDIENGPGWAKLEALKAKLREELVVQFFRSAEDLLVKVLSALTRLAGSAPEIAADLSAQRDTAAASDADPHRRSTDHRLELQYLLCGSVGGGTWHGLAQGQVLSTESRVRAMVRPKVDCHLLLVVETVDKDGQSVGLHAFAPGELGARAAESTRVVGNGAWQTVPRGHVLVERVPERVGGWRLGLLASQQPPLQLFQTLQHPDRPFGVGEDPGAFREWVAEVLRILNNGGGADHAPQLPLSQRDRSRFNLGEHSASLLLTGTERIVHWTEVRFGDASA